MENERFLKLFGQKKPDDWNGKVFLAVVHVEQGGLMLESALYGGKMAYENGADGVLLIDMKANGNYAQLTSVAIRVIAYFTSIGVDFSVGVNYLDLGNNPDQAIREASLARIPMLWTDSSDGKVEVVSARTRYNWQGVYLGAFAFKYKAIVLLEGLPRAARESLWMDVSVTSGPATGQQIDPERAKIAAQAIPGQPLGIASGVSVTNVLSLLSCGFWVFIVGTSLYDQNGKLDPKKIRELANLIHGWSP